MPALKGTSSEFFIKISDDVSALYHDKLILPKILFTVDHNYRLKIASISKKREKNLNTEFKKNFGASKFSVLRTFQIYVIIFQL